jgi:hypothetical protein
MDTLGSCNGQELIKFTPVLWGLKTALVILY